MARRNWKHSTIFIGDNLAVMRGMNSGLIDLIYLDPPFNSNHNYAAPMESPAAGAAFKDTWTLNDIDNAWHGYIADKHPSLHSVIQTAGEVAGDSMKSYLVYMAIRILEMKRLLKDTGSLYLHCDPTAGHYLKLALDAVFGRQNFRNEIIWSYKGGALTAVKTYFPKKHDVIYFYSKSKDYHFENPRLDELSDQMVNRWGKYLESDGKTVLYGSIKHEKSEERRSRKRIEKEFGRKPRDNDVAFICKPSLLYTVWDIPEIRNNTKYVESTGYPTQKPLALLNRIIRASSNEGDIVFDPFCGCATTCIEAEYLKRKWVGCDIDKTAGVLVERRLQEELGLFFDGDVRDDLPVRTKTDLSAEENELFGDVKHEKYNSLDNKYRLFHSQGGVCNGCLEKFDFKIFHIDHIVPRSRDGNDHISNLQLLCGPCNMSKGNRPMSEFVAKKKAEFEEKLRRINIQESVT